VERILANKTISLTELREPEKVLAKAGNSPVAVLNHSHVVGYFVPKSAVDDTTLNFSAKESKQETLEQCLADNKDLIDYLRDK